MPDPKLPRPPSVRLLEKVVPDRAGPWLGANRPLVLENGVRAGWENKLDLPIVDDPVHHKGENHTHNDGNCDGDILSEQTFHFSLYPTLRASSNEIIALLQ